MLLNHKASAFRAFLGYGFIPAHKVTFGITFTSIKFPVFTAHFFQQSFTAFGARRIDIIQERFCIPALREIRACKESAEFTHLVDHHRAALVTLNITDFIFNINLFDLAFSQFQGFLKFRIEFPQELLPVLFSFFNGIQPGFHGCGEFCIYDIMEKLAHHVCHHDAEFRRIKAFLFSGHISAGDDRGNRRSIC